MNILETIAALGLKVSGCRQLMESMKVCNQLRSMSIFILAQGDLDLKIKIMVFSDIIGPMKLIFYVEPPCLCGTKWFTRNLGRIRNIAPLLTNAQKLSPEPVGKISRD